MEPKHKPLAKVAALHALASLEPEEVSLLSVPSPSQRRVGEILRDCRRPDSVTVLGSPPGRAARAQRQEREASHDERPHAARSRRPHDQFLSLMNNPR